MDFKSTPIKLAFHLAWSFFLKNKMLNLFILLSLFGMALLSMIPIVGLFFYFMLLAMFFSMQVSIGKTVFASSSLDDYYERVATLSLKEVLFGNLGVAFGYFTGFFLLELAIFFVLGILAALFGDVSSVINDVQQGYEPQISAGLGLVFLIGGFIMMWLGYIFPIVVGHIYNENSFGGAFKGVFKLLSPSVWKLGFNLNYFLLVVVWILTTFVIALLATFSFASLLLIPVGLFLFYYLALLSSGICAIAKEITQDTVDEGTFVTENV